MQRDQIIKITCRARATPNEPVTAATWVTFRQACWRLAGKWGLDAQLRVCLQTGRWRGEPVGKKTDRAAGVQTNREIVVRRACVRPKPVVTDRLVSLSAAWLFGD